MARPGFWPDRVYPALLVSGALAAYLGFACPYVLGGDNGEFLALAARGGVAHPPGYPLFTLLLRALTALIPGGPALRAARATAVLAALAAGALYFACRSWRASPEGSLVAGALYASSPLAWLYATQAEVFTLNALLCATLVGMAGPAFPLRGERRLAGLALVAGLGLSHLHTILALAPIGLLGTARGWRECARAGRPRAALLATSALALGLAPYAYLLHASRHPEGRWVWGDPMSLPELLHHFLRAEYWEAAAQDHRVRYPTMHAAALARSLGRGWLWGGGLLVVAGLARAVVRSAARGGDRWGAAAFGASGLLAGPVLLAVVIGRPVGFYTHVVERFHLLPLLVASVPLAWGADLVCARVGPRLARGLAALAVAGVLAFNAATVPDTLREAERPTVEHYLRNTLGELPPGAVVVGTGDHRCFGFLFLQTVLGVRPDVVYVEAGLLRDAWYRARVARELGAPGVGGDAQALIASLAAEGRPVFVTDSVEQLVPPGATTYALGTAIRVLPPGEKPPGPEALETMNLEVARGFVREPSPPRDPWTWSGEVDGTYARPWLELARAFSARGMPDRARVDLDRALSREQ